MAKPNDGGPAYPVHGGHGAYLGDPRSRIAGGGLTKREAFAMYAMQGMLASGEVGMTDVVECAVDLADDLLAELNKE